MFGRGIPDEEQFQPRELRMIAQIRFCHCESFDQTWKVFLRFDISRVKHEWIGNRVTLQNAIAIGGHGLALESFVEGVVNNFDFFLWNAEHAGKLALGRMRDSHDSVRTPQRPPRKIQTPPLHARLPAAPRPRDTG